MNTKFALIASLLAVSACSPQPSQVAKKAPPAPQLVVSENQITALLACLKADKCSAPVQIVKISDGDVMHMVSATSVDDLTYRFFYTDSQRFGVMVSDSQKNTVLVEDDDLNGKADRVAIAMKDKEPQEGAINERDKVYPLAQETYAGSMLYVGQIVPKKLNDAIAQLPPTK